MKNIVLEEQMELSLENKAAAAGRSRKKAAPRRADWWFTQMRKAVDRALDWQPRPTPPARQNYLPFDGRHA